MESIGVVGVVGVCTPKKGAQRLRYCSSYFRSRSPSQEKAHEDFISRNNEIGITVKSLRVRQVNAADPKLEQLAAIGAEDPDYQMMINHIERGIQENLPEENSELLQLKGDFVNLGLRTFSKGKLIVKNGSNVMIPSQARKFILKELHSTHLCPEMMKNIYHGRFFWAKISKDVEQTFLECTGCQREAKSKTCEVIPPDLTQLAPTESISIDYASYNNQDILVIKDRSSGFIGAVLTKDKSSAE